MKLDENNIDHWLNNKLKDGASPLENSLLQTILEKNQNQLYKQKLFINIITASVFVLIVGFVYFFNILESKEITQKNNSSDEKIKGSITTEIKKADYISNDSPNKNKLKKNELKSITVKNQFLFKKPFCIETSLIQEDFVPVNFNFTKMIRREVKPMYKISDLSGSKISSIPLLFDSSNQKKLAIQNDLSDTNKAYSQWTSIDVHIVKSLEHSKLRISFGIGSVVNQTKIINHIPDLKFTNKYYQNTISQAFSSLTGNELNAGIILELMAFSFSGAINYSESGSILIYKIPIKEVPLIDINGEIKGYTYCACKDSIDTQVSTFVQKALSVPMSIALKRNLPRNFVIDIGIGALPNLKTVSLKLPGRAYMRTTKAVSIKPFFTMPLNLQWGIYKTFPLFTLGINGVFTPYYSSKMNLPGEQVLKTKQNTIRLSLIKTIKL